jgi:rod shape-determining protein MreD
MTVLGADFRRELGVSRYPMLVYVLAPLAALVLQAWLPRLLHGYAWFDLPLVVTVYFALARRDAIQGTLMGAGMGLFEDALTTHAIGVNGVAKTVVGFLAGSVGVRIDVEDHFRCCRARFTFSSIAFCWGWIWIGAGWSS